MNVPSRLVIAICLAQMLTACFTGIESTPAITDKEVRRQQPDLKPEDTFFDDIASERMSAKLYPGKQWVITDPKIKLLLDGSAAQLTFVEGDTLTFKAVHSATTIDGRPASDIELTDSRGNCFLYRTPIEMKKISSSAVEIPFTVDLDLIGEVSAKMLHKQFFITTRTRYDMTDNTYNGSRRFVSVTVDSVMPGNSVYPIRLSLTEDSNPPFRLYMSSPFQSVMPRKFSSLFSLDNPRKNYPAITDSTWDMIVDGKVAIGMTRDECRLSVGEPDNVDRAPGYSSVREIWTYRNGRYLVFIDGLLESFRN